MLSERALAIKPSSSSLLAIPERVRFRDVLVSQLPGIGRYTAGPSIDHTVAKLVAFSEQRMPAIVNILGEHDHNLTVIEQTIIQYIRLLEGMKAARSALRHPAISLKPTQFGLDSSGNRHFSGTPSAEELRVIGRMMIPLVNADAQDIFTWLDMENRYTTDFTLHLYRQAILRGYHMVGIALQANLYRTEDDLRSLIEFGVQHAVPVNVRLVRGIYQEPANAAYTSRDLMHQAFARLIRTAFLESGSGFRVSVGSHHPDQVVRTLALAREVHGKLRDVEFLLGAATSIPKLVSSLGFTSTYYVPCGPRFLDYGLRRLKENPLGMVGLIAAPFFDKRNARVVQEFVDGRLAVDLDSAWLPIAQK